jgi:hypothetical protein
MTSPLVNPSGNSGLSRLDKVSWRFPACTVTRVPGASTALAAVGGVEGVGTESDAVAGSH